jgi:hypothetical protein
MYLMFIHFSVVGDYRSRIFATLNVLVCTYFSLNELYFHYSEQLRFISLATFTCKVMGV